MTEAWNGGESATARALLKPMTEAWNGGSPLPRVPRSSP